MQCMKFQDCLELEEVLYRLALNILSREENEVENLTLALNQLKNNIKLCSSCYNLSIQTYVVFVQAIKETNL